MKETNSDTAAAWRFHAATKYRVMPERPGEEAYVMGTLPEVESPIWEEDWSLEPSAFKVYTELEAIGLPADLQQTALPALEALSASGEASRAHAPILGKAAIGQIARLSNGLLNRQQVGRRRKEVVQFRTAGATGARYHLELYFVCCDLPDLPAGVYHYATRDNCLRKLRTGDVRGALVEACGSEPSLAHAPLAMVVTSTFWRNAFRYKARAYRHTFWDAGTLLTNTLAVAASLDLPYRLVMGFADRSVNHLLGVDGEREAAIAVVALGRSNAAAPEVGELPAIEHATEPVSSGEVTFPEIGRLHAASSLGSGAEAAAWRRTPPRREVKEPRGKPIPLEPLPPESLPQVPIEQVIMARRSTRHYDTERRIGFQQFSTVLDRGSRGFAADGLEPDALPLHDNYLIVNAVEGLEPGVYLHRTREGAIELLRPGEFRMTAAHLAYDQPYAGDAHVNSYYLAELSPILERYGNRGYRLAQLEAALCAGRLHLATHAVGLRAVDLTSFDDEVVAFFSPDAADASYLFISVFGARRPTREI